MPHHALGKVTSCCGRQTACWRPTCCRLGSMSIGDPNKSPIIPIRRVQINKYYQTGNRYVGRSPNTDSALLALYFVVVIPIKMIW